MLVLMPLLPCAGDKKKPEKPRSSTSQSEYQAAKDSTARLLPQCSQDGQPAVPTAPPPQDLDDVFVTFTADPGGADHHSNCSYARSQSEQPPHSPSSVFNDGAPNYSRSVSGPVLTNRNGRMAVCPSCSSSIAPPTYDESREHQVLP